MSHDANPLPPIATLSAAPVLEYALPGAGVDPRCVRAARWMVGLAVLSGLCVAVCFAAINWGPFGAVLHLLVFGTTIGVAVRAGAWMAAAGQVGRPQLVMDGLAGLGLVGVGIAPVLYHFHIWRYDGFPALLGVSFLLMALTTYRHRLMYRTLAAWSEASNARRLARTLRWLGTAKVGYEAVWLTCCWVPLLLEPLIPGGGDAAVAVAVAALFGCLGYGVLWIWMIVSHAQLAGVMRRLGPL